MKNKFESLDSQSEHKDVVLDLDYSVFKISHLVSAMVQIFQGKGLEELNRILISQNRGYLLSREGQGSHWFNSGVNCKIFKPGNIWQTGKIRIKVALEFCSDEPEVEEVAQSNESNIKQPESPLDDIRQMMNGNS